jgi:hypothetical protein
MISNYRRLLILVCFIWQSFPVILLSQTVDYIDGKVINSATQEPVPFATIQLKNHQLGVYANADGDFRIVRTSEFQSDSVIITCIGFKRYSLGYTDLNLNLLNKISLAPVIYGLSEITVLASGRKLGSLAIIGRAIRNIKNNYPGGPFNYVAYFRDYQKRDGKYLNLNEAIIQALDNGFESNSITNKYRLLDFRKNMDFPRMNISPYYQPDVNAGFNNLDKIIPWATLGDQGGNELLILMVHDAIRNFNTGSFSFINILSEDFIYNHNFSPPVSVYNNNLMLFKIIFNGKSKVVGDSLLVSGAIYIQPKYYSIHKLEYSCSYKTRGKPLKEMFNVDIEYGHENSVDSLMCLKYVSFNNIFDVVNKDDSTCFKVLRASLDTTHYINPTLVVNFNNKIDPITASRKDNYEIMFGKKTLKIKSIQVNGKTLFIRIKDEDFKKNKETCRISIHNIKDADGNILDKLKSIELYQYREMFVQEYNKNLPLTDSCFVKYLPLEQNCISKYSGNYNYWMNTPEKIKNTRVFK